VVASVWAVHHSNKDYIVSIDGEVYNRAKNFRVSKIKHSRGYLVAQINRKSEYIHSMVLLSFGYKRPAGYETDHIDTNKENNKIENLEFVTQAENKRRAVAKSTSETEAKKYHDKTTKLASLKRWKLKGDRLKGTTYGYWEVIGGTNRKNYVLCKCKCGKVKEIYFYHLTKGATRMCRKCSNVNGRNAFGGK